MKKKILIGSIIAVVLLLLMPSIPAVQQRTVEEGVRQDIQKKFETFPLDDLDNIEVLDSIMHPILYIFVLFIVNFRLARSSILYDISSYVTYLGPMPKLHISHPRIFLRADWLVLTAYFLRNYCNIVSDKLGWNWEMPFYE